MSHIEMALSSRMIPYLPLLEIQEEPMTCQYHYEIIERPTQVGGGVRLYLYGPNPEAGEQIDYGGGYVSI